MEQKETEVQSLVTEQSELEKYKKNLHSMFFFLVYFIVKKKFFFDAINIYIFQTW